VRIGLLHDIEGNDSALPFSGNDAKKETHPEDLIGTTWYF